MSEWPKDLCQACGGRIINPGREWVAIGYDKTDRYEICRTCFDRGIFFTNRYSGALRIGYDRPHPHRDRPYV